MMAASTKHLLERADRLRGYIAELERSKPTTPIGRRSLDQMKRNLRETERTLEERRAA